MGFDFQPYPKKWTGEGCREIIQVSIRSSRYISIKNHLIRSLNQNQLCTINLLTFKIIIYNNSNDNL